MDEIINKEVIGNDVHSEKSVQSNDFTLESKIPFKGVDEETQSYIDAKDMFTAGFNGEVPTWANTTLNFTTNELANMSAHKILRKYQEGLGNVANSAQTLTINITDGTGSSIVNLSKLHIRGNLTINVSALTTLSQFVMQQCKIDGSLIVNITAGTSAMTLCSIAYNDVKVACTVNVQQGFDGAACGFNIDYNTIGTNLAVNAGSNSGTLLTTFKFLTSSYNTCSVLTQYIQSGCVIGKLVSGVVTDGYVYCNNNNAKSTITQQIYNAALVVNTITVALAAPKIYGQVQQLNNIANGNIIQGVTSGFVNNATAITELHNGIVQNYNISGGSVQQNIMTDTLTLTTLMTKAFDAIASWTGNTITLRDALTATEKAWLLTPPGTANNPGWINLPAGVGARRITAIAADNKTITFDGTSVSTIANVGTNKLTMYSNTGVTQLYIESVHPQILARLNYLKGVARPPFIPALGLTEATRITAVAQDTYGMFVTINAATNAVTNGNLSILDFVPVKFYGTVATAFPKIATAGTILGSTDLVCKSYLFNDAGSGAYAAGFVESIVNKFVDGGNQGAGGTNTCKVLTRSRNGNFLNLTVTASLAPVNNAAGTLTIRDVLGAGTITQNDNKGSNAVQQTVGSAYIPYAYAVDAITSGYNIANAGYTQAVRAYQATAITRTAFGGNNPGVQVNAITSQYNKAATYSFELPANATIGTVSIYRSESLYDVTVNLGGFSTVLRTVNVESIKAGRNFQLTCQQSAQANACKICGQVFLSTITAPNIYVQRVRVQSDSAYGTAVPTNGLLVLNNCKGSFRWNDANSWFISSNALIGVSFNTCDSVFLTTYAVTCTLATSGNHYGYVLAYCDNAHITTVPADQPRIRIINCNSVSVGTTFDTANIYNASDVQGGDPQSIIIKNKAFV